MNLRQIGFYVALLGLVACPESDDTVKEENKPKVPIDAGMDDNTGDGDGTNVTLDAGSVDGSGTGVVLDAGSVDGSGTGVVLDAGGLDGTGTVFDAGFNGGLADSGNDTISNGGNVLDAGPSEEDSGVYIFDCSDVDTITFKTNSNSGQCGAYEHVTLRADGRVTQVNQAPYPENGLSTCVPSEGRYEIFRETTQQLIDEMCNDFVKGYIS